MRIFSRSRSADVVPSSRFRLSSTSKFANSCSDSADCRLPVQEEEDAARPAYAGIQRHSDQRAVQTATLE
eukprot:CAMPEP_0178577932 /NCGR_PEP_ID=MMETSP0697-20121206/21272_1 /TAXON_ID=265572 /ORGANISM="Extubocellulus spinifer, Strain CCMP396" /LENGTH=69 /DNA_ID=CAMNT_0020213265 /DNA_START=421 /DNA_END=630 /DNA_ORIENTATION=+